MSRPSRTFRRGRVGIRSHITSRVGRPAGGQQAGIVADSAYSKGVISKDDDALYESLRADLAGRVAQQQPQWPDAGDRKSTRLNSSHVAISYAVFCLKKKKNKK